MTQQGDREAQGAKFADGVAATLTSDRSEAATSATPTSSASDSAAWYEIHEEHARGGIGRVLRAEDRRLGRIVALKELLRQGRDDSRRFLREVQLTARLQHPGIVPIYEAGHWQNGTPFYAMKFIDGRTLRAVLRTQASFEERLALLPKIIAVVETMAYVHNERVIHRDLKPANVLIGPFGETLIVDWGLAKELDTPTLPCVDNTPYRASAANETVDGVVLGTPAYMPPEQARGEEATLRSDVYALGAMIYELLTGGPPYRGSSSAETLHSVLAGPPASVDVRVAGAPRELVTITEKAMAREPLERYADAAELAEELVRFQTGQLVKAHSYSPGALVSRWVARNRRAVGVAVGALIAMALGAVVSVERIVRERDRAEARGDELILTHAQSRLGEDPTAAVAWAKVYPSNRGAASQLRSIVADAESRGVARHVFRRPRPLVSMAKFSHDGSRLATEEGDVLRISDVKSGRALARIHHGGTSLAMAWTDNDRAIVVTNWVRAKSAPLELLDIASGKATVIGELTHNSNSLEVSGDQVLVAGGADTVQLWNLKTHELRIVARHSPRVSTANFSPDGAFIVSTGPERSLAIFERRTGKSRIIAVESRIIDLRFFADGHSFIAVQDDGHVTRWDVTKGTYKLIGRHEGPATSVDISSDGQWVATGSDDRTVRVWNLVDGRSRVFPGHESAVSDVAFSKLGPLVVSASSDGALRVWHLESGTSSILRGHTASVQSLSVTSDGRYVASTAQDKTVRVWDLAGIANLELVGHNQRASLLAQSPDGKLLATAGVDRTVRLWSLPSGTSLSVHHETTGIGGLVFSPDGARLAIGSEGSVAVLDASSGVERTRHAIPSSGAIWDIQYSPDGSKLAVAEEDGVVHIFGDGAATSLSDGQARVRTLSFSTDGRRLATGGDDRQVRVWDLATGVASIDHVHDDIVSAVQFSPDGRLLASASWDRKIVVHDQHSGALRTWQTSSQITKLTLSHSSTWLAFSGADGVLTLRNLVNGQEHVLIGHEAIVLSLAFSPNDERLASAGWDQTARIWNVASGDVERVFRVDGNVNALLFSVRGDGLFIAPEDGIVRRWALPLTSPLAPPAAQMLAATTAVLDEPGNILETE